MEEQWLERYELVRERLSEIKLELESQTADVYCLYWLACVKLALGETEENLKKEQKELVSFADYAVCHENFGKEIGRYYGILFAQMLFVPDFYAEKKELACICCELLVELYLIAEEKEDKQAIRDTLYWFYSDYCEMFLLYFIQRQENGSEICVGGPMLFMEKAKALSNEVWKSHETDYGLYIGNRFLERLYQAVGRIKPNECQLVADLLESQAEIQNNWLLKKKEQADKKEKKKEKSYYGFSVTQRQAEGLSRTAERMVAAISHCDAKRDACYSI